MAGTVETGSGTRTPDIAMMRVAVGRLLPPDVPPTPAGRDLGTLTRLLRGHLALLIPEGASVAGALPDDDIPRYCALACLGEARMQLNATPTPVPGGDVGYARRLARVLNALCDETLPYDQVSPSGGAARAGHIHVGCKNTGRRH
ncbi:DUF6415 family natural product biosynthesis protein [Streptomyces sp. NPDC046900]|uniref:DUF6415 family natural product biosynthesis protein n=1 Tax=Streptomyces sp. NPDC046900 TaxID=3155473 RepID=UPI0033F0AECD